MTALQISTAKLIIFDCDGILVDSENLGNNALADLLVEYGYQVSANELKKRFHGMKLRTSLELLQAETGIVLPKYFEDDLRERAAIVYRDELQPVEGALQLVGSLQIPFCVASSGPREKIEKNLRTTKLLPYFVGKIFSAYEVNSWKPDPGVFLSAAKYFGVPPRDCVVIEDSLVGVNAGLAANMTVLGLDSAAEGRSLSAADRVFESLAEIHELFVSHDISSAF